MDGCEPEPSDWPVLVTGAGGFVGGHVARELAGADTGCAASHGVRPPSSRAIRRSIGWSAISGTSTCAAGPWRESAV